MKIYLIKKDINYWLSCKVSDEQSAKYMEDNFGLTRVSFGEWLTWKLKHTYRQIEKRFWIELGLILNGYK